ncbi:polysaccharide deacetylase family protein [Bacteroidota bacterium]
MRQAFKLFLGIIGGWIPHQLLILISGQDMILPFYHTVSDLPMPHVENVYPVRSVRRFKRDLEYLLKHFEPVGLEALKSDSPPKHSKPAMLLSFDDGLSEIHDIVAPLLAAKGVPAAFFVNTDFVDNRDLFFRYKSSLILDRLKTIKYSPAVAELFQSRYHLADSSKKSIKAFLLGKTYMNRDEFDDIGKLLELDFGTFLKIKEPYMSLEQIRTLADQGFYIGAHSKDHPLFSNLSMQDMLLQYRESMEFVRREIAAGYGIFSFPFTDHGVPARFFDEIKEKDMPRLDASFGAAGLKKDPLPFHYQRIPMEVGRIPASVLLKGEYLYYLAKGLARKNEIQRI